MYIVIDGKEIIAAHEKLEIINDFIKSQKNPYLKVLKSKNKSCNKYEDFYLVRYGDSYVPYNEYMALRDLSDEYKYDLNYSKDVLFRLLEEGSLTKKEQKHVLKTVEILLSKIEESDKCNNINIAKDIYEMNKLYKERID